MTDVDGTIRQLLGRRVDRRIAFSILVGAARARIWERDAVRFVCARLTGEMRRITLELGKRLHSTGWIASPRDVFFLEMDELTGFVEGMICTPDLQEIVSVRRAAYDRALSLPDPEDHLETCGAVNPCNQNLSETREILPVGDEMMGLPCSPGQARGLVRRVDDPTGADFQKGDILVFSRTDPGWIALFPLAGAIVMETGNILSHAAVVARELHIPMVCNITGALRWLNEGDLADVDGDAGRVRILERLDGTG